VQEPHPGVAEKLVNAPGGSASVGVESSEPESMDYADQVEGSEHK